MMIRSRFLFGLAILLSAGTAYAQFIPESTEFHALPDGLQENVVPWANPSEAGPMRAVAVSPHGAMGDIAQLRDHLEMDLEVVALWEPDHLGFDPRFPRPDLPEASRESVIERLADALGKRRLDLIILAQFEIGTLPEEIQKQIVARVEEGVGLLVAHHDIPGDVLLGQWLESLSAPDETPDLLHGVGPLGIDRDLEPTLTTCYAAGEGRVVHLTLHHAPTTNHSLIPIPSSPYNMRSSYAANAYALVARAARWAARQSAAVQILDVVDVSPEGPDDEEIPPGFPPEFIETIRKNALAQPLRPYVVRLDRPADDRLDVWYRLRHLGADVPDILRSADDSPLRKGSEFYPLDVLAAPGNYLLDVWLKSRKGTVAWHTQSVRIPGWPTLGNIELTRDGKTAVWTHPNDYVVVRAEVGQSALTSGRRRGKVFVRAVDSLGRQVANNSATVDGQGGPVEIRLDLADLLAPLVVIEVFATPDSLADEAAIVSQAARETFYLPVRLPEPSLTPTLIVTMATRPDHGTYRQLKTLRETFGLDAYHAPLSIDTLLAAGRTGVARLSQLGPQQPPRGFTGSPREPCLSSPDFAQEFLGAIASGVLQSYAGGPPVYSLGAGNALTHTDAELCYGPNCLEVFRAQLRARYANLENLNEAWNTDFRAWSAVMPRSLVQCREDNHLFPWIEFRMSMNSVFANHIAAGRTRGHQVDPQARIGFQPPTTNITPQTGIQWDLLAASTDYLAVPDDPGAIRRLRAYHGVRPWNGIAIEASTLNETPEQSRWYAWNGILQQLPAIWLNEPFARPGVRLLGPTNVPTPAFAAFGDAHREISDGIGQLLLRAESYRNDIAFLDTPENALFAAVQEDSRDETDPGSETWLQNQLNVLGFVPGIRSLTPGTSPALEGLNTILLADTHILTRRQAAALTDFHKDNGLIIASRMPKAMAVEADPARSPLPFLHPVLPDAAEPLLWSNRPVWVRGLDAQSTAGEQLNTLLEEAGNEPMPAVDIADKHRHLLTRYYFAYDKAKILVILPHKDVDGPLRRAHFSVPEDHYGYDLRSAAPDATSRRIQWSPQPGEPAIYALLPYRVKGLELTVAPAAVAGERLPVAIRLDTGDDTPGRHLIRLRVEDSAGTPLDHYGQVLETQEGQVDSFIPLSENEGPARYTVFARDVLTGTQAEHYVTVQ